MGISNNVTSRRTALFVFICTLLLASCSDGSNNAAQMYSTLPPIEGSRDATLAKQHQIQIDLSADTLTGSLEKVLKKCRDDREFDCTILESSMQTGVYPYATATLRMLPDGIPAFVETASAAGEITSRRTAAEELASPIRDADRQISELEQYLNDLRALRDEAKSNIDSLIKLTSEVSRAQSELEALLGDRAQLQLKVDTELLRLHFSSENEGGFWRPVKRSLDNFAVNLAEGIASFISVLPYLLPWLLVVLIAVVLTIRWRRRRYARLDNAADG